MPVVREASFPTGSCRATLPPVAKRTPGKNEYLALGGRGSGVALEWASQEHPPRRSLCPAGLGSFTQVAITYGHPGASVTSIHSWATVSLLAVSCLHNRRTFTSALMSLGLRVLRNTLLVGSSLSSWSELTSAPTLVPIRGHEGLSPCHCSWDPRVHPVLPCLARDIRRPVSPGPLVSGLLLPPRPLSALP